MTIIEKSDSRYDLMSDTDSKWRQALSRLCSRTHDIPWRTLEIPPVFYSVGNSNYEGIANKLACRLEAGAGLQLSRESREVDR